MDDFEGYLEDIECVSCGHIGLEYLGADMCVCPNCGEEIDITSQAENLNYWYDEVLCNVDEEDKGEIFD